jgi:hypothetical protein
MSRIRGGALAGTVAVLVAAVVAQGAAAATLKADYRLQDTRTSSVAGAPALTDLGAGNAFASESVGACPTRVLTFPKGGGLSVPTAGLIGPIDYSVVMTVRLADISDYRRLLDFKGGTSDNGLYAHDGKLDFYDNSLSPADHEGAAVLANNRYAEIALTQENFPILDQVPIGYVDGAQQFTVHSLGADLTSSGVLRFFKDDTTEDSAGGVSRIRLYDGVLSPAEVKSIYDQGPLANPGASCAGGGGAENDFTFGKLKRNKKKGTAKLAVEVPGAGSLELTGKGLKPSSADATAAGEVKLPVKAKGKAKKKLRKKGKKKFEPAVTFTPIGGTPNTEDTKVKLVKK